MDDFDGFRPDDFLNGRWTGELTLSILASLAQMNRPITSANWAFVNSATENAIRVEEEAFNFQEAGSHDEVIELPYSEDALIVRDWIARWKPPATGVA
jgi:hypothetical protein